MRTSSSLAGVILLAATAAMFPAVANTPKKPSEPIAPGNQKAYCRGEVAGIYNTRPVYVTTGRLLRAKDGTTSVSGTVDLGNQGIKKFKCKFDRRGRLFDVMAMTSDGE